MEGDLYKNLTDGAHEAKPEHLPDCINLLVEGFSHKNDIWGSEKLDKTQLRALFVKQIHDVMAAQDRLREYRKDKAVINFIYVIGGKLVCCFFTYEIQEYRRGLINYVQSDIPLYRELERQGSELVKSVDIDKLERGKYIFAVWTAHVDDPSITTQQKQQQLAEYFYAMRSQGFLGMIGRSTNTAGVQIMLRLGTEKMRQVDFHKDGNTYKLYFLRLNFYNSKFQNVIKKITNRSHINPNPKL